jgi:4'-phosphopantetheinyl transferase
VPAAFRKFWSLKEAFTKARGDGLKFEFNRCSFEYVGAAAASRAALTPATAERGLAGQPVALASVLVDGKRAPKWRFYVQGAEDEHFISVARGPPSDVVDANGAFKATFTAPLDSAQLAAELARPEPPFVPKRIAELVPELDRSRYEQACRRG